ncbi:hypothetical protein ABL78_3051 [Leptomonas seymouri]|uniref:Uncharacterized protein n=1 Tax=Leptomonas seymouri TaxID=5684 RepID=A0A0N1IL81_LEPSE|nr:hypothetical protein ABL78_3051 [Leptomonas seymouri]|eukprot:KPI87824.1 hypothetical protein ABL78_3051 [Leptomonas seymouri]
MKIPAALHPANHPHVQCLLLQAGLCADGGLSSLRGRREMYKLARTLALSRVALGGCVLEPRSQPQPYAPHGDHRKQQRQNARSDKKKVGSLSGIQQRAAAQLLRGLSDCFPPLPTPHTSACHPTGRSASTSLLRSTRAQTPQTPVLSSLVADMAFTQPSRLVPLYAPRVLLPPIPQHPHHDDMTYDAAVHHAGLLAKLLSPYGFEVELTGSMRRGCPLGTHADYILSLSEQATREAESVHAMGATDNTGASPQEEEGAEGLQGSGDGAARGDQESQTELAQPSGDSTFTPPSSSPTVTRRATAASCKVTGGLQRDAFTIPIAASMSHSSTAASTTGTCPYFDAGGIDIRRGSDGWSRAGAGTRRKRWCSRVKAFSASDAVSPQVAHLTQRAIQCLVQCGYVVAGQIPLLSPACLSCRQPIAVSVRYDTCHPAQVPPIKCADPRVLARLELHRLNLFFCPWQAHAVRNFFLTGPPAFTAHVTLQALSRGVDLNMNGAFECVAVQRSASPHHDDSTAALDDADEVVEPAGTAAEAAVENRSADRRTTKPKPRLHQEEVVQVLLCNEESIFEVAGLPVVDPLLRAVYGQLRHLP